MRTGSHVELAVGTSSAPVDEFPGAAVLKLALTLIHTFCVVPAR